jgi:hypothetical protein
MDRIAVRREAMMKADMELYEYSFSLAFDRAKHADHDRLVSTVKRLNYQLISAGQEPLCSEDRRKAAQFCCIASGRTEIVEFAD